MNDRLIARLTAFLAAIIILIAITQTIWAITGGLPVGR